MPIYDPIDGYSKRSPEEEAAKRQADADYYAALSPVDKLLFNVIGIIIVGVILLGLFCH